MLVLKFGGTSVGSPENIQKVITIVSETSKKERTVVVVSAFGGITDQLLKAGVLASEKDESFREVFETITSRHLEAISELQITNSEAIAKVTNHLNTLEELLKGIYYINELSSNTIDKLSAYGELLSSLIITEAFNVCGSDALHKNATELIKTTKPSGKHQVDFAITNKVVNFHFKNSTAAITIVPGFIASNSLNEITTLGRGGSDFSAAIIAAAVHAKELQIWTDVSGMYTANPKLVKQARPIQSISYQEAMELSHFGAKVLYPPTILPVMEKGIPIVIKNTSKPEDMGTHIASESSGENPIKGLSHIGDIALLTLEGSGMVGIPGISRRLFETLSNRGINIIMITQASSEHSICLGILESDANLAKQLVDLEFENEIALHKIDPLTVEKDLAIIALVGENMKNHQGISGKMFQTLGKNNVNIRAIAQGASEKNISAVIKKEDVKKALNVLHERFFEDQRKQINLFIAGVGNVGSRLLEQIKQQKQYLKEKLNINVRVIGMTNSRKMLFSNDGISLNNWQESLAQSEETAGMEQFIDRTKKLNMRNSIFVDITASDLVAKNYASFLKSSIAVVACNKIACSANFESYQELKQLATKYNAPFLFETNVGAGLPIIDTLNNLIASGDEILKIQAVLSGSLNFVFNNFSKGESFHDVVKQAQAEGYTEPDPRIDLSGVDVARKILILARESGLTLELEDVVNRPFLTEKNLQSSDVAHFYETLIEDDEHFQQLVAKAESQHSQLKYVAQLIDGKPSVGLEIIPQGHPFYNLEGKDNIVLFYSKRYPEQPLIVKGAGAGGDVTASGLFSDIIRMRTY